MRRLLAGFLILGLMSCGVTEQEISRAVPDGIAMSPKEAKCLAEAIYFEAGNVAPPGREAVAHVILNRVKDSRFPGSVCDVIAEGEDKRQCQFSYRCDLDPTKIRWPEQMQKATETVDSLINGQSADPTGGALFFHAKWMPPGWFNTRERVGQFGGNIFYL